jgi:hypothetical protein
MEALEEGTGRTLFGGDEGAPVIPTAFGLAAIRLELDPPIARLVYKGAQLGFPRTAAALAGIVSCGGELLFRGGDDAAKRKADEKKAEFVAAAEKAAGKAASGAPTAVGDLFVQLRVRF